MWLFPLTLYVNILFLFSSTRFQTMKRPTFKISQQQNRFPIIFYEILSKRKDCRSFCIIFRCFSVDVSCDENVLKNILSQLFVWCYFVSPFLIDCDFFVSLYVTSLRGLVVTSPQKEMFFLRTTIFQKALLTLPLLHFTTVWLNSKEKLFLFTFNFFGMPVSWRHQVVISCSTNPNKSNHTTSFMSTFSKIIVFLQSNINFYFSPLCDSTWTVWTRSTISWRSIRLFWGWKIWCRTGYQHPCLPLSSRRRESLLCWNWGKECRRVSSRLRPPPRCNLE